MTITTDRATIVHQMLQDFGVDYADNCSVRQLEENDINQHSIES